MYARSPAVWQVGAGREPFSRPPGRTARLTHASSIEPRSATRSRLCLVGRVSVSPTCRDQGWPTIAAVDDRNLRRTRNTHPVLLPETRRRVEEVVLGASGTIYYRLSPGTARPTELVDDRGRTVLEAFGALPMQQMSEDIDAYRVSMVGVEGAEWDADQVRNLVGPLVAFLRTFGPIGIGWGGQFGVRNPEVERLERDLERLRVARMGIDPATTTGRKRLGSDFWTASFWGHAPGRDAVPAVRRRVSFPGRSWDERIRLEDDGIPHDFWPQIVDEHQDLTRTLELVEAIARRDRFGCKRAVRLFVPDDGAEFWVGPPAPLRPSFREVAQGFRPSSGRLAVYQVPDHQIDWIALGRRMVADLIARQIDFAMPLVDVAPDERLRVRFQARSVLEAVYLRLLDHVQYREGFGIGRCGSCDGPILRTRRPGKTGNQWHRGCHGGRVLLWRQANPGWRRRRNG